MLSITPSEIVEYLFCPRFIYFMNCIAVPQSEQRRLKVLIGREIHKKKEYINKDYLRKKIGCIDKELSVYLSSEKVKLRGIVDEVLHLKDGTLAPLDYKFTVYKDFVYRTHRIQNILYGLLIEENYGKPVNKGFVVYVRSKNYLKEVEHREKDKYRALNIIEDIFNVIINGFFPKKTKFPARCIDCCYKNICVK
ncbi:CRISPR-associated protein Cas4 [candidate division KSB1 bacterium]|nr:MAG: CRISPR-associated protein Cas4 [candidate division KSB1 bacterium]